jgi:hypothetical protein
MKDITEVSSRHSISVLFVVGSDEEVLSAVDRRSSKRNVEKCCGDGQTSKCDVMMFRNTVVAFRGSTPILYLNGNCNFGKSSICCWSLIYGRACLCYYLKLAS